MSAIFFGKSDIVFGLIEPTAEITVPKGAQVRLRSRNDEFARAFVRTKHGITEHYLTQNKDGSYSLGIKCRENQRVTTAHPTCWNKKTPFVRRHLIIRHRPAGRKLCL